MSKLKELVYDLLDDDGLSERIYNIMLDHVLETEPDLAPIIRQHTQRIGNKYYLIDVE